MPLVLMPKFLCWCPDSGDESGGVEISRGSPSWAAEDYAEREYSNNDCAEEITVWVRDSDGEVTKWTVCAEPSVTFTAVEAEEE